MRRLQLVLMLSCVTTACARAEEPRAFITPSATISPRTVTAGSLLEMTYAFTIAEDAPMFDPGTRVFVHFVDHNGDLAWTDDHQPPVPPARWTPRSTIRYTRTLFAAGVAQLGEMQVDIGLYEPSTGRRLPLHGAAPGSRAYRVGTIAVRLRTDTPPVTFAPGWYPPEGPITVSDPQWHWSTETGVLSFRNPRRDVVLLLDVDEPLRTERVRTCTVRSGSQVIGEFPLTPERRQVHRIPIAKEFLGAGDRAVLTVAVDRTVVPGDLKQMASADPRALGVRVFRAYVQLP